LKLDGAEDANKISQQITFMRVTKLDAFDAYQK